MSAVLDNYAEQVRSGLKVSEHTPRLSHLILGLNEEAGEVAGVLKKSQYTGNLLNFSRLEEELGDVLWYLQGLCNAMGLTIETLAKRNIEKLVVCRPDDYTLIP
jgi:NTP pyrophosphatase (non-canonical NTP hydrolase)